MPFPYREIGHGEPVVLLHAFPLSARMWEPNAGAIAASGFSVIAPEFPGFGENQEFERVSSMESMADGVLKILESLNIERASFVGLSMGGYVLFSILRKRPDIVAAVALCDTTARADTTEKRDGRAKLIALLESKGSKALVDEMLPNLLSQHTFGDNRPLSDSLRRQFLECDPDAAAAALRGMAERPDSVELLAGTDQPVVLIFGEEDKVTGLDGMREMADAAPSSETAVISDAGHYSNLENPKEFNRILTSFLKRRAVNH